MMRSNFLMQIQPCAYIKYLIIWLCLEKKRDKLEKEVLEFCLQKLQVILNNVYTNSVLYFGQFYRIVKKQ